MGDYTSSFMRAADISQIQSTGESMEDTFLDYLVNGSISALTSAAVGFYNTGVALGEVVGFADETDYADESEVITNTWGAETGSFYERHKTGVDVVGMIAGSLIPGGAAIKALQAAQRAGKLTKGLELASGIKRADLVLGSKHMREATNAVLGNNNFSLSNPAVWRAYSRGLGQQVMEAAVAEVGIIATMNQNASLNPEDLGYFEASKNQLVSGAPFVLAGGALGGGLEVLRVRGALKKSFNEEFAKTSHLAVPELPATIGMSGGDKVLFYSRALEEFRTSDDFAVAATDTFAAKQKEEGLGIIKTAISDAFIEVNKTGDKYAIEVLQGIINPKEGGIDFDKLDSLMSGLDAVTTFDRAALKDMRVFYSKTDSAAAVYDVAGDIDAVAETMAKTFFGAVQRRSNKFDNLQYAEEQFTMRIKKNLTSFDKTNLGTARLMSDGSRLRIADLEEGILLPLASINSTNIDSAVLGGSFDASNAVRKAMELPELSKADFSDLVMLHELTHAKANTPLQVNAVWKRINQAAVTNGSGKHGMNSAKFVEELVNTSISRRGANYKASSFTAGLKDVMATNGVSKFEALKLIGTGDIPESLVTKYGEPATNTWTYLMNPKELLADAGSMLTFPGTRESAAKLAPQVAKFFDKFGGIAKSFSPQKHYYNARTGKTLTSHLPGIMDMGPLRFTARDVFVQSIGRTFKKDSSLFDKVYSSDFSELYRTELEHLDYSAQYAMAENADIAKLRSKEGELSLSENDVPMLERMLQEDWADPEFNVTVGDTRYTGGTASKEMFKQKLIDKKLDMRGELLLKPGVNEHDIAQILNMDVDRAAGFDLGEINLMGIRKMDRPEVYVMNYTNKLPSEYKYAAHSAQATQERLSLRNDQRQKAAAVLLGDGYTSTPAAETVAERSVQTITGTETRAGIITANRPGFGTLRELASYVGQQVSKMKTAANQTVAESFAKFYEVFNAASGGQLRAELSQATNLISRDRYVLLRGVDEEGNIIRGMIKKELADDPAYWGVDSADAIPDRYAMPEETIDRLLGSAKTAGTQDVVRFSDSVGEFIEMNKDLNAARIQKKQLIAEVKGGRITHDPEVLYAPPRDLTKTKHFAFVQPSKFMEGADKRKYMVYGQTAEELQAKIRKINEQHGSNYKIVTNQEVKQHKQLMQEYDSGLVFDEVDFDASSFRTGTSAELAPSLDIEGSYTLDRYRSFNHRQEEYLINAGIELKYAGTIESLRRVDTQRSRFQKSGFFTKDAKSTIWKDTERMFFDDKGTGGEFEQLWVKVNDFIGDKGSEVISKAYDTLRKSIRPGEKFTQAKLDSFNTELEALGYNPPFRDVMEAVVASPEMADSRIVPAIVKTMNNLASSLMLRLDMANSIIQTISTPILMLPVLKEAKQALRAANPEAYAQLENLTTVVNPANGMKEPTVMKMLMKSVSNFFSEDGKQFMEELRGRGLVPDYLSQYLDATDLSTLNGRHTLAAVNDRIDKMAKFGGKFSGFQFSEEFSRFLVADSVRQIADIRGIPTDELWPIVSGAIDKVHGIYRSTQRAQLFQGPLGQAIGLYQTYMFNFAQNALKFAQDSGRGKLASLAALQAGTFGLQSFPGFGTFNSLIGNNTTGNEDIYSVTNADDPNSLGAYFMFGLGSHALGVPIDFFSRGDMAIRNKLIIPTAVQDIPAVSIFAKAISNVLNVADQIGEGAPVGQALLHGLAHNGMNRPLQGLGTIMLGYVGSGKGGQYFQNSNYVDYNAANEWNWGGTFARLIGTKPLNEAIYMNSYFRDQAYQANMNAKLQDIGTNIQLSVSSGQRGSERYGEWASQYEEIGGDPQNFNAYWSRQLSRASKPEVEEFRREMQGDTTIGRVHRRLNTEYSEKPIWEY